MIAPRQGQIGDLIQDLACPVCRKTDKARIYHIGVREDPECPVYICSYCRIQYIEPPYANLQEYYQEEYRKVHDAVPGGGMTAEERFKISQTLSLASALVFKEHVPAGCSVLEIGCGSGGFLYHLMDDYECYGNEWNPEDAAYVRDVGELPCEEGILEEVYPGKTFGAIIARQVLEHVPDPIGWLMQIKHRLIGGGWIYMEVPHAADALLTVYDIPEFKTFWYREPHITYWHADVLAATLSATKMEARTSYFQRYGLENHMHWLKNRCPMDDPLAAQNPTLLQPAPKGHPGAPSINRRWAAMDKEYRLEMEALLCTDSLRVIGRRREI